MIEHEIRKYENFIRTLNLISARYCSQFPDLVSRIAELRTDKVQYPSTAVVSVFDNPLSDIGAHQLATIAWRSVAKKLHPDFGGDPVLFHLAHSLYLSDDYQSLQSLSISIEKNDLTDFKTNMSRKINSLYEVQKSKIGYKILCLDLNKEYDLAKQVTKNFLEKVIKTLENA